MDKLPWSLVGLSLACGLAAIGEKPRMPPLSQGAIGAARRARDRLERGVRSAQPQAGSKAELWAIRSSPRRPFGALPRSAPFGKRNLGE